VTKDGAASPARETDFGFERLPAHEKKHRVRDVFDSVAPSYDLMNDVMSFGMHRLWKRLALLQTGLRAGDSVLDVAAGSGDLSLGLARQVGPTGQVVVTDVNARMLAVGRDRIIDAGFVQGIHYVLADAEALPFAPRQFECVTIGFGLRNVTDKSAALASMFDVLRPGGRLLVLEFSKPHLGPFESIYDAYSFQVLPRLGQALANDADSYRYLAESIRRHPDQGKLLEMMRDRGFERCTFYNLSGGIVALHIGYRL
jgi:demethylmenaquinone methyltransferase/2-methoxy-6-polyprenyl-1,4-benzoquinol methylase